MQVRGVRRACSPSCQCEQPAPARTIEAEFSGDTLLAQDEDCWSRARAPLLNALARQGFAATKGRRPRRRRIGRAKARDMVADRSQAFLAPYEGASGSSARPQPGKSETRRVAHPGAKKTDLIAGVNAAMSIVVEARLRPPRTKRERASSEPPRNDFLRRRALHDGDRIAPIAFG